MIDDIGLGNAIASYIYLAILVFGAWGIYVLFKKKYYVGCVFLFSLSLNFFLFLFLMGKYWLYPKGIYNIVNKYWPLLNLILLVILIISIIKNRGFKKNA
jgi:hypothetical protein